VKWMDGYLTSRKSGGYPHGMTLLKSRRGTSNTQPGAGGGGAMGAGVTSPTVIAGGNLTTLRFILSNGVHRGIVGSSTYDSDDDPSEIVGE
jgi:hypothetical protein